MHTAIRFRTTGILTRLNELYRYAYSTLVEFSNYEENLLQEDLTSFWSDISVIFEILCTMYSTVPYKYSSVREPKAYFLHHQKEA